MELTEQQGEVQVEANENIVVGVSADSTVCVWNRQSGKIRGTHASTELNSDQNVFDTIF